MSQTALKAPADGFVSSFPDTRFDAILVVSFGGPEGMDDVMPFLENVTRGRNVPRERLEEVAHHYELFGGVSPINAQNRELDRGAPRRARRARDLAADLLRQPQLASVPRRHAARDGRRRYRARARVLHLRLLLVLGLPPVPRGPVQRAAGGGTGSARGRPNARVLQPPGLDRGQRRSGTRSARGVPAGQARASRLHRPLDPVGDGTGVPLRGSAPRVGAARRRGRRRRRLRRSSTRAAAALRTSRGSSRTSSTISTRSRSGESRTSSSRRSDSSPITSRSSSISTSRRAPARPSSG